MIGITNVLKEPSPKYINCWNWPPVFNNGYTFLETNISDDGLMMIRGYETSAGHEGFTIKMTGLTVGVTYIYSMDYIHNVNWVNGYSVSFMISSNQSTASLSSSNYGSWGNKIRQNGGPYSYSETFTANAQTMFLGFSGNGFSDSGQNHFTYYNMRISVQR